MTSPRWDNPAHDPNKRANAGSDPSGASNAFTPSSDVPAVPPTNMDTFYKVAQAFQTVQRPVQVVDNCYGQAGQQGTIAQVGTYEFFYNAGMDATDIQVGFGQWLETGAAGSKVDTDTATTVTFSAAVRDAANNVFALTFAGQRSVTLAGGGFILSDALAVEFAKGDLIHVRVFLSAGTADVNRSATAGGVVTATGGFTATTDLTATGAAAVTAGGKLGWGPRCIIGKPLSNAATPKAVVIQGDSIAFGCYDALAGDQYPGCYLPQTIWVGGGYLARALAGDAGVINNALPSDTVQSYVTNQGHFRRAALARFARYAMIEYGVVDLAGGRTAVQLQTDLLTLAKRNLAKGVVANIIQTILPDTTSTDNWATVGNQTAFSGNAARVTHNNWVRDGGPIDPTTGAPVAAGTSNALRFGAPTHPIRNYIEVADVAESARDSGKWKAADRAVSDAAITTGTAVLTSATAAFTNADVGKTVIVPGAGAAGAALVSTIWNVTNATTANLENNAGTTVSANAAVIGPWTADGVHPRTNGHAAIAAAIKTPLLAMMN